MIDAATRRIIWDRLSPLGVIAPETEISLVCVEALVADDMCAPGPSGYVIGKDCIYPEFPDLLGELARISPDTANEQKSLLQLDQALARHLDGDELHPVPVASTALENELWEKAAYLIEDLTQHWLPTERRIVGLAGSPPRSLMRRLLEGTDGVVLCAGHFADAHPRLTRDASQQVDILITVNASSSSSDYRLAPGGLHISLNSNGDLFETLRKLLLRSEPLSIPDGLRLDLKNGEGSISWGRSTADTIAKKDIPPVHIIGALDAIPSAGPEVDDWLLADTTDGTGPYVTQAVLSRINAIKAATDACPKRLWIVTRETDADASLQALARVLSNEGIEARAISHEALLKYPAFVLASRDEPAISIQNDAPVATRLEPFAPATPGTGDGWQLLQTHRNDPNTLGWQAQTRRAPDSGEVEVAVAATGLNFRDVLWAQGLLPEEALADGFTGPSLGMEFSGIVTRSSSDSFPEGTPVMGFSPAAFSSHITAPATTMCKIPKGVRTDLAAAIPTIFVTALYGLENLARLQPGETVLIHGAAGGVGLAAMQVARQIGARIIATAGTPEKRRLLEILGAEAVFDSRSMAFADHIREMGGVDVVLNSLWGEAMERSIGCLKPFGRFVELGKRDFYANNRMALRPFRRNLSYFALDADQLFSARPDLLQALLARLHDGFTAGDFRVPPCQIFGADDTVDAFRLMQRSGHIGKILISPPKAPPQQVAKPDYSGTWLVTGGLGGFGLETANWLAAKGADRLVLTSRRGKIDDKARARIKAHGALVDVVSADICDRHVTAKLLEKIGPLKGIIHAAMVLDDALFIDTAPDRIEAVLKPKIDGLANLEALTKAKPPTYFICYSSIATIIGNPGQAAYVTANAYLEERMRARHAAGLHGLAIGWGPLADAGLLAQDAEQREMIAKKLGAPLVKCAEALAALDRFLACNQPVVSYSPMNWGRLAVNLPALRTNLTERLDLTQNAADGAANLAELIDGLDRTAALRKITEILAAETSAILRMPPEDVDPQRPLADLGFDSLMALNLRMVAEEKYGVQLPLIALMDGTTLAQASAKLLHSLTEGDPGDEVEQAIQATHGDALEINSEIRQAFLQRLPATARLSS